MEAFFHSKVYVVTGGADGIGLATVALLLEYGASVCAVDLHKTPSKGLAALPQEHLTYIQADVKIRNQSHEVITAVIEKHHRLDGLVNSAGICPLEGEMPGDDIYDDVFDTNVRGSWNFATEAVTHMKSQGSGSIVNLGSLSSHKGVGRLPCYTATKHALAGLTRTWALDFAKYGVRVNMVSPGPTDTRMVRDPLKTVMGPIYGKDKTEDELLEYVVATIPMKRLGTTREQANAIAFFLSDFSSFVTGQVLMVAGGS